MSGHVVVATLPDDADTVVFAASVTCDDDQSAIVRSMRFRSGSLTGSVSLSAGGSS
jgi:hypothetical protein